MKGVKVSRVMHGKRTKGQRKVLEFVSSCIDSGLPPSSAEITEHFEWTSPNAAQTYLKHLERNGFLELAPGKVARGIKLTPLAVETLGAP